MKRRLKPFAEARVEFDPCGRVSIEKELSRATLLFPAFHSAHEGFAVLLEEVDELWDCVKVAPGQRSMQRMRAEAVQVAAMALRFIRDVCDRRTESGPSIGPAVLDREMDLSRAHQVILHLIHVMRYCSPTEHPTMYAARLEAEAQIASWKDKL